MHGYATQQHRRLGPRSQRLEGGDESVRDTLRRPLHAGTALIMALLAQKQNRLTLKKLALPMWAKICQGAAQLRTVGQEKSGADPALLTVPGQQRQGR